MNHGDKITFGEIRESGVRAILVYCSDFRCSHSIALSEAASIGDLSTVLTRLK
jgi:hypothetical protein